MDASSEQCAKTTDGGTPRTNAVAFSAYLDDITEHPEGTLVDADFARALERELIQALHELNMATNAGVIECAIRNKAVAEYMNHWETRAVNAERELAALSEP